MVAAPLRPFDAAAASVSPCDAAAGEEAGALFDRLTKPRGALGRLESLGAQLAAMAGACPPPLPEPAAVAVFAGDHGVVAAGVTPWPQEVTAQMVANFCAGGAAINVLARHFGATVVIVDVGVATPLPEGLPTDCLVAAKVRAGTGDISVEPAMTLEEARRALDVGAQTAARLIDAGARCVVMGEMGIGNSTPAAAVIAALCHRPPSEVTGRGTGIDDAMLAHKVAVVERALGRVPSGADTLTLLADLGGLEIAALAGFVVGAAASRVPVIVDGVIAAAAALVACRLTPDARGYLLAGHRSTEPGASAALANLDLVPVLDLEMRLGEGSGACLAVPIVQAAAHLLGEMATFDSAGVTDKDG